jgi:hypothetical protein
MAYCQYAYTFIIIVNLLTMKQQCYFGQRSSCMNLIMEGLHRLLCTDHQKTSPFCLSLSELFNTYIISIMVQYTYNDWLHN